jgi:hypothetical protein
MHEVPTPGPITRAACAQGACHLSNIVARNWADWRVVCNCSCRKWATRRDRVKYRGSHLGRMTASRHFLARVLGDRPATRGFTRAANARNSAVIGRARRGIDRDAAGNVRARRANARTASANGRGCPRYWTLACQCAGLGNVDMGHCRCPCRASAPG